MKSVAWRNCLHINFPDTAQMKFDNLKLAKHQDDKSTLNVSIDVTAINKDELEPGILHLNSTLQTEYLCTNETSNWQSLLSDGTAISNEIGSVTELSTLSRKIFLKSISLPFDSINLSITQHIYFSAIMLQSTPNNDHRNISEILKIISIGGCPVAFIETNNSVYCMDISIWPFVKCCWDAESQVPIHLC
jgi:hypothetical protein